MFTSIFLTLNDPSAPKPLFSLEMTEFRLTFQPESPSLIWRNLFDIKLEVSRLNLVRTFYTHTSTLNLLDIFSKAKSYSHIRCHNKGITAAQAAYSATVIPCIDVPRTNKAYLVVCGRVSKPNI